MRILLDTCDFLWFISGDAAFSEAARRDIQDARNEVFLSVVSVWEIVVNHARIEGEALDAVGVVGDGEEILEAVPARSLAETELDARIPRDPCNVPSGLSW